MVNERQGIERARLRTIIGDISAERSEISKTVEYSHKINLNLQYAMRRGNLTLSILICHILKQISQPLKPI